MRPIDTIDFPDILMCMQDKSVLYILSDWKGQVILSTLDASTFKIVSRFNLALPVNYLIRSIVDDSSIYIPTMNGEIIGIDKFSGEKIVHCDLGLMTIVSNIEHDDQHVYTICGLPIVQGLKTDTEIFCVTASSKESGQKIGQSQIIRGQICPITVKHGYIWGNIGKLIYKFSPLCEEIGRKELQFSPNYKTVVTDDFVCASSNKGSLEIFNRDLQPYYRLLIGTNNSPPVSVGKNLVCWFVGNELYLIDLDKKSMSRIYEFKNPVVSTPKVFDYDVYATDRDGNIIGISRKTSDSNEYDIEVMHVAKTPFRQPIVFDNYILLVSKDKIYRIER